MTMHVYIIPGHGQKSPSDYDPGTSGHGLVEAPSVRVLASQLQRTLTARGIETTIDGEGQYPQRHARAWKVLRAAPGSVMAVLHLHHDSGPEAAHHALAMHDRRSTQGALLAKALAAPVGALQPFGSCKVVPVYDDRPAPGAWLYHAHNCIHGVIDMPAGVSACLVECGFLSHAPTAEWFKTGPGYALTAEAIAAGAVAWLTQRAAALKAA